MNAHKNICVSLLGFLCLALGNAALWGARPDLFTTVTPEKINQLEKLHQKATDLLLKNDFQGAIGAYSDILLVEPDDETAYTALGQIYLVMGQYQKSREAFLNALHIDPDNQVASTGIQRILAPDGVEGIVSRTDETENNASAISPRMPDVKIKSAVPRSQAKKESRTSAMRAERLKNTPVVISKRRTFQASAKSARPGFLNGQRIQMALKNAGVYGGPVNGLIGGSTKKAVLAFQEKQGLPTTGKVTSATWRALSGEL